MDEDVEQFARVRTDYAEDRTVLAYERTFAGWLRTGFAGIGIGIAFNALFTRVRPEWVPKLIASVFLAVAIFIFMNAERRACAVSPAATLRSGRRSPPAVPAATSPSC